MREIGNFKGIGKVHTEHKVGAFLHYDSLRNISPLPGKQIRDALKHFVSRSNSPVPLICGPELVSVLSRDEAELLEKHGIVIVLYNKDNPDGAYALSLFPNSQSDLFASSVSVPPLSAEDRFVLKHNFRGSFSLQTQASQPLSSEQIESAPFENLMTSAQVIAVCTKTASGDWCWSASDIYPDALHVQAPLTATEQYAQSCFEGLLAMVNEEGEIITFRPNKNAERLQLSCQALCIPPVDIEQFLDSVRQAVLANKRYLPRPGSNAKLYIRPFVKGQEGGYGVGPASSYLFAIQVFPFGDYMARRDSIIHIVGIPGKRRSHGGGFGAIKASGNYGQTILDRVLAKQGLLETSAGKFSDTFYLGEKKAVMAFAGKNYTVVEEVMDEDSAGNLFFIGEEAGKAVFYTVPLERQSVLPGITRLSIMRLAAHLGYEVREKEISLTDARQLKGAFVSGSAVGMVRVASMTYAEEKLEFDQAEENSPAATETTKAFFKLYDLLYAARKGKLRSCSDSEIASWAHVLGKVN